MAYKPIFVVGTPRSGTTLTAKILGRHSRIFMPGETHFFDDIFSRVDELGDVSDGVAPSQLVDRLYTLYGRYYEPEDQRRIEQMFPAAEDLAAALSGCNDFGGVMDRFMTLQMEAAGKVRWGNNAPRDLFSYREIKNLFPDAKFVVCVRDIRAFLISYQGKWKVTGEEHVERLKRLYHPVVTSYLWKSSMRQIELLKEEISEADRIIVPYERLVTQPESMVREICEVVEEEFEPSMLAVSTHNSSDATEERGIFSTSIDRWRSRLTPEEIAIGQSVAGRFLGEFGYSKVDVKANIIRMLGLWVSTPVALWRALDANKDVRGPLIPYLAKRVGALLSVRG